MGYISLKAVTLVVKQGLKSFISLDDEHQGQEGEAVDHLPRCFILNRKYSNIFNTLVTIVNSHLISRKERRLVMDASVFSSQRMDGFVLSA